jgi:tetratricopeptide (TPR) repeat protein
VDRGGKYIHSPSPEFYRPRSDPEESDNQFDGVGEEVWSYREALGMIPDRPALPVAAGVGLDPLLQEQLRQLGYAAAGNPLDEMPDPLDPSDRPAPRDMLSEMEDFLQAERLADRKLYDQAIELFESILRRNPGNLLAMDRLGYCLAHRHRWSEVIQVLTRRLESGRASAPAHNILGYAYESTGDLRQAAKHYRLALQLDPGGKISRENLDRVLDRMDVSRSTPR